MIPFSVECPEVLLECYSEHHPGRSFAFAGLTGEVVAWRPEQVRPALDEVERAVGRGLHAAGFLAYEAAPGLEAALATRPAGELPLVWFGLFRQRRLVRPGDWQAVGGYSLSQWQASIARPAYAQALRRVRQYIRAGDTYQVNFSFRLRAAFAGDAQALYRDLCQAQQAPYCAYLNLGRHCLASASPELFFTLDQGVLTTRPMKGTRPRGRCPAEDAELAGELRTSAKERAENVMIVDLLRNDLGRVSALGSVQVTGLWEVEEYATVLQMTSTVQSRQRPGIGLSALFAALFPCGSVTGAPKVRTMEIIAELEDAPRALYTGCIGFVSPGPEACFNVAIRTAWVDQQRGQVEFGVGGGITWDSSIAGEYEECRIKARVLPGFEPGNTPPRRQTLGTSEK